MVHGVIAVCEAIIASHKPSTIAYGNCNESNSSIIGRIIESLIQVRKIEIEIVNQRVVIFE